MSYRPKARTSDFVEQTSGDDTLIYDLKTNKAVCLNETAAIVWKLCDGKRTVSEIAGEAGKQLKSSVNEDFVLLAIDQLKEENLLVNGEAIETKIGGLSRREVIEKVGIASMVALPIVTSIIAPKAIAAQSSCGISIGVCLPAGTAACPLGCAGFTVIFRFFGTGGATCTGTFVTSAFVCGAPGPNFPAPTIVDSLT